ncbi:MAG: porin family protein [Alphaproteobacteria bacterium]|nr:porin family protein [Alphaproteobacteria bacterium]
MKHLTIASLFAISVLAATSAQAQRPAPSSFYGSINADLALPSDSDVKGVVSGDVKYGFSSGGNFAIGYQTAESKGAFGRFRVELEGGMYRYGLDSVTAGLVTNSDPKGDLSMYTVMGNLLYDIKTPYIVTPYVGVGVGEAFISYPRKDNLGNTDSTDSNFAYQFMAGLSYSPESMPQSDVFFGYRYLNAGTPEYPTIGGKVKIDSVEASNLELGYRYHF